VKQEGRVIVKTKVDKVRRRYPGSRYGRGYPGPVSASVRLDRGRQIVLPQGSQYGTKAFLAMTKSGHLGVFVPTYRKRTPIQQLFGPGVGDLFGTPKAMEHAKVTAALPFVSEFPGRINLFFVYRCCRPAVPPLRASRNGRQVLNISQLWKKNWNWKIGKWNRTKEH